MGIKSNNVNVKPVIKLITTLTIIMVITLFLYNGGASIVADEITSSVKDAIEGWRLMFILTAPTWSLSFIALINR